MSCMLDGVQLDPGVLLASKLYGIAFSTKGRIVISGIVTSITRVLGVEHNPEDRVFDSEWLDQPAFEIMDFCKAEPRHLCWI